MTERVIRIGIPKKLADELVAKDVKNDWVGKMLCREAAGNVISLLIDLGEINLWDNVDVEFRSDEKVREDDISRRIWISDITLEDETEKEENIRVYFYTPPVLKNKN